MPDLALSHLPPIIVPKRSPSGPGLVHQPLTRDSHAAGNRGRAVASLRAAVRLVRATCAREWHPQIAASELGPAKRGHHFPNRDDPHESRPRSLYMVVNDAIGPVVLEVTTIDRPPRVEAVSVTEGLDETDGEQCRGHLRAARPCACAETEPRQVAPPGFVRYRRQETAACWRRKASSMTLLRPSGQPGWRPLLTLGVVGRDGQPGYGSVAASRLIDAGARSVVGADIDV